MIPRIRDEFNATYKEEYYENLLQHIKDTYGQPSAFRISETPVFISKDVKKQVEAACAAIINQLWKIDFSEIREKFIPKELLQCLWGILIF